MAIGDAIPVVMGPERGAPLGVATLDSSGILALAQRPNSDQILMPDGVTTLSTALSNKAALSVQQTVEQTTVPTRTVEVAAEDLPGYIAGLPRLLTEDLTITVSGGVAADRVFVWGFYGLGTLTIRAKENEAVLLSKGIQINFCGVFVYLDGLQLSNPVNGGGGISVNASRCEALNCSITGDNTLYSNGGVSSIYGGAVYLDNCSIKDCGYGLNIQSCSSVVAHNCAASGNITGITVMAGGIVLLSGTTPELLGGNTTIKGGGIIARADGTLL